MKIAHRFKTLLGKSAPGFWRGKNSYFCLTRCSTFWLAGVDAVFMFFTAQPWLLCFVRSANGAM